MAHLDLTPDPKVLVALTRTPMSPLDALCELIDNSLDSFHTSQIKGDPIKSPLVIIDLPKSSELGKSLGKITIRDNGSGMSAEQAEKAMRAGYSGNNSYDSLGLFGMGFNISSGKLGRKTRFVTARKTDEKAIEVILNLDDIREAKSYNVPFSEIPKPTGFEHGTLIEISEWWRDGDANSKFVKKLVQYGMPKVRNEIGRRYSTILRRKAGKGVSQTRILINGEACPAFEHCVWGENRFVEHRAIGQIPAVFSIDHRVGGQIRCTNCTVIVDSGESNCPSCGSSSIRTIDHQIKGWVGIQRFDSDSDYGIDIVRNGRTIRIGEKSAFFEFTDEFKKTIKDYPIDSNYGRIVGEIHLNHVPVDFLKQDFQRTTAEWDAAMSYLRGDSSLQPKQAGASENVSPIFKLFQGYRRVRNFGKGDMYMGFYDANENKAKRISRDIEKDFYQRFLNKEPGYWDDAKWWDEVENADKKPLQGIINCPHCDEQNLDSAISCSVCDGIISGKKCLNAECAITILANANSCPTCGSNQEIEEDEPWVCNVCKTRNSEGISECSNCAAPSGSPDPMDITSLLDTSNKDDALSIPTCTIRLADGSNSDPIDVEVFRTTLPIKPWGAKEKMPVYTYAKAAELTVFLDMSHDAVTLFDLSPEQFIAAEVANFIRNNHNKLSGSHPKIHTLPNLAWQIIEKTWGDTLNQSSDLMKASVQALFDEVRERMHLSLSDESEELFGELTENDQRKLVSNLMDRNEDVSSLSHMKVSGRFIAFVANETIVSLFGKFPELFLNGSVWNGWVSESTDLSDDLINEANQRTAAAYLNYLQDLLFYLKNGSPETQQTRRCRISLDILSRKFADDK